ncbi:MAG: hypothetical protein H7239_06925 [Flavobacterium sp.]|nr:hypothetical protein [Flavobacterium sp.]
MGFNQTKEIVSRNIKMKLNESKFNEIQNLLKLKLGDRIMCSEDHGTKYLQIKDTEFWISTEFNELVVGIGLNHTHFSEEYGNLDDGIIQAFDLLTNKVKTTKFIKGKTIFKTIIEIEYSNSKTLNIGQTGLLIFPFWKKTKIETTITNPIMTKKEIENEVNNIIN